MTAIEHKPGALRRLTKRNQFQRAARGNRAGRSAFGLQAIAAPTAEAGASEPGIGFTVTKKIGGAVVRNRMKRRLRALAREVLPAGGFAGADHVLIGRAGGIERDYASLAAELTRALKKLGAS